MSAPKQTPGSGHNPSSGFDPIQSLTETIDTLSNKEKREELINSIATGIRNNADAMNKLQQQLTDYRSKETSDQRDITDLANSTLGSYDSLEQRSYFRKLNTTIFALLKCSRVTQEFEMDDTLPPNNVLNIIKQNSHNGLKTNTNLIGRLYVNTQKDPLLRRSSKGAKLGSLKRNAHVYLNPTAEPKVFKNKRNKNKNLFVGIQDKDGNSLGYCCAKFLQTNTNPSVYTASSKQVDLTAKKLTEIPTLKNNISTTKTEVDQTLKSMDDKVSKTKFQDIIRKHLNVIEQTSSPLHSKPYNLPQNFNRDSIKEINTQHTKISSHLKSLQDLLKALKDYNKPAAQQNSNPQGNQQNVTPPSEPTNPQDNQQNQNSPDPTPSPNSQEDQSNQSPQNLPDQVDPQTLRSEYQAQYSQLPQRLQRNIQRLINQNIHPLNPDEPTEMNIIKVLNQNPTANNIQIILAILSNNLNSRKLKQTFTQLTSGITSLPNNNVKIGILLHHINYHYKQQNPNDQAQLKLAASQLMYLALKPKTTTPINVNTQSASQPKPTKSQTATQPKPNKPKQAQPKATKPAQPQTNPTKSKTPSTKVKSSSELQTNYESQIQANSTLIKMAISKCQNPTKLETDIRKAFRATQTKPFQKIPDKPNIKMQTLTLNLLNKFLKKGGQIQAKHRNPYSRTFTSSSGKELIINIGDKITMLNELRLQEFLLRPSKNQNIRNQMITLRNAYIISQNTDPETPMSEYSEFLKSTENYGEVQGKVRAKRKGIAKQKNTVYLKDNPTTTISAKSTTERAGYTIRIAHTVDQTTISNFKKAIQNCTNNDLLDDILRGESTNIDSTPKSFQSQIQQFTAAKIQRLTKLLQKSVIYTQIKQLQSKNPTEILAEFNKNTNNRDQIISFLDQMEVDEKLYKMYDILNVAILSITNTKIEISSRLIKYFDKKALQNPMHADTLMQYYHERGNQQKAKTYAKVVIRKGKPRAPKSRYDYQLAKEILTK